MQASSDRVTTAIGMVLALIIFIAVAVMIFERHAEKHQQQSLTNGMPLVEQGK